MRSAVILSGTASNYRQKNMPALCICTWITSCLGLTVLGRSQPASQPASLCCWMTLMDSPLLLKVSIFHLPGSLLFHVPPSPRLRYNRFIIFIPFPPVHPCTRLPAWPSSRGTKCKRERAYAYAVRLSGCHRSCCSHGSFVATIMTHFLKHKDDYLHRQLARVFNLSRWR